MSNEYTFGVCKGCGLCKALKDGACSDCAKVAGAQFEDFFKEFLKEKPSGI